MPKSFDPAEEPLALDLEAAACLKLLETLTGTLRKFLPYYTRADLPPSALQAMRASLRDTTVIIENAFPQLLDLRDRLRAVGHDRAAALQAGISALEDELLPPTREFLRRLEPETPA